MGGKQLGFSDYELTTDKKQTTREKFLAEMEAVVYWQALIESSHLKGEKERRPAYLFQRRGHEGHGLNSTVAKVDCLASLRLV